MSENLGMPRRRPTNTWNTPTVDNIPKEAKSAPVPTPPSPSPNQSLLPGAISFYYVWEWVHLILMIFLLLWLFRIYANRAIKALKLIFSKKDISAFHPPQQQQMHPSRYEY